MLQRECSNDARLELGGSAIVRERHEDDNAMVEELELLLWRSWSCYSAL